jgi:hypothetical protein
MDYIEQALGENEEVLYRAPIHALFYVCSTIWVMS